ncbi:MAG: Gfo/Idh/MocA family protein [Christensenellales bacterium]|jgi:predicted dehydrogenase
MNKKLTVAFIGCGSFARMFVPLFQKHPLCEKVYVCDIIPERAQEYNRLFDAEIIDSFETAIGRDDITAVAIFTQRHLHGDLVIRALHAGKDVYSAVPMGISVEECRQILDAVKETGRTYMMGETCIYYPCSMFCKEKYESGEMGKFVYADAQYYHDISHFSQDFRDDLSSAGVPPFFYPTHSTAMVLNALNTYATRVVSFGYEDQEDDPYFKVGVNQWDNVYSNGYSLMKLANGGTARINECRRISWKAPSSTISGFYGTRGGYQFSNAQHVFTRLTSKGVDLEDVSAYVNPRAMEANRGMGDFKQRVANHVWQDNSPAPIQDREYARIPPSYAGLPNNHMASHQLLIDDFCTAAYHHTLPRVHAWKAARFTIPGLCAHESMVRNGEPVDIPDFGDGPEA